MRTAARGGGTSPPRSRITNRARQPRGAAVRTAATLRITGGDGSRLGVAASAVRQHLENSVLRGADLTRTAFVVLWVVGV
ncbi:hypothetical protein TPA0910_12420 [Streptomyces hygroscopicus subsp. sporocinereus]|uniref:Uncharacterized protein n=1 Tax=Streptomyces hygroscopicus TaxID=1912 RepID=A0ABQ3TU06_STRHY|nr:hypothetical protein TPA0910_12420 [Streptomyces hygroscopicus]